MSLSDAIIPLSTPGPEGWDNLSIYSEIIFHTKVWPDCPSWVCSFAFLCIPFSFSGKMLFNFKKWWQSLKFFPSLILLFYFIECIGMSLQSSHLKSNDIHFLNLKESLGIIFWIKRLKEFIFKLIQCGLISTPFHFLYWDKPSVRHLNILN